MQILLRRQIVLNVPNPPAPPTREAVDRLEVAPAGGQVPPLAGGIMVRVTMGYRGAAAFALGDVLLEIARENIDAIVRE